MPKSIVSKFRFLFAWEYGFIRFVYFMIFKKIQKYSDVDKSTGLGGVDYSKKAFYDGIIPVYRPSERTMLLLNFLNSIPNLNKNKLLIIGPRYETEILLAKAFGFKNIKALDTFSYSPLIDCGDMHKMEYEDNFFNSIVCGWTLTYSNNPEIAAKEMIRVMKKNSILVLGIHKIDENFDISKGIKGQIYDETRPQNKDILNKIFGELKNIYYIEEKGYVITAYKKI
jgi:hypothetical protein